MTSRFSNSLAVLAVILVGLLTLPSAVYGAEEEGGVAHYPLESPLRQSWSFGGFFGHWDRGQLQRGLKVYTEVCSACHSLSLVSYRNLSDLGYSASQIKTYASQYDVTDGPDEDGEMFDRPARASDRFVSPFLNDNEARSANNGALPPDLSLIAKARSPERGFPLFVFDIFTMYAEGGPDYIYSLLTGYSDAPSGIDVGDLHYNPYFISSNALAMAPPLDDDFVEYDDGSPQTIDQYSRDVSAFLMWASEPGLEVRKRRGFMVLISLLLLSVLLYFVKRKVWSDVGH